MAKSFQTNLLRTFLLVVLLLSIIVAQIAYDGVTPQLPLGSVSGISPEAVRLGDMGFHSTVAAFLWVNTLPQVLDLFFNGKTEYFGSLDYLNSIDPRFAYPYAYSVLTLPAIQSLKDRDQVALAIGRQGIAEADPDWRIPYYMGSDYFLGLNDVKDALYYYDIASRTPGIPAYAKSFALNFGAIPSQRERSEQLWATIRDSATDDLTKARAQVYIDHYRVFDYLQAAVDIYKKDFKEYPKTVQDLVAKKIIPQVPQDPFGFSFVIGLDGVVGIDTTKPPVPPTN